MRVCVRLQPLQTDLHPGVLALPDEAEVGIASSATLAQDDLHNLESKWPDFPTWDVSETDAVSNGVENTDASCTRPVSPLPFYTGETFGMNSSSDPGDALVSAAAASYESCASTPLKPTYPPVPQKRGAQDVTAAPRRNKHAKVAQLIETPPSAPLLPLASFDQGHVNKCFGSKVKKGPMYKMQKMHTVFHNLHKRSIASFEVCGDVNVYGFTNVHVRHRTLWDEEMIKLGKSLSRPRKDGKELKEPRSCIYEMLMCYGGMEVVRSSGASSRNKSLMQDSYTFTAERFASTKARVNHSRMGRQMK